MLRPRWISAISTLTASLFLACGESSTGPLPPAASETGNIEVRTVASGWDTDGDGFDVYLDGEMVGQVGANDTLTIEGLTGGSYELLLRDLASNCSAERTSLQVTVSPPATFIAAFSVTCEPLPYGLLLVGAGPCEAYLAREINNLGKVIGSMSCQGSTRAFVWEDGVTTELGTLGGLQSWPTDINDRGQIVGASEVADGDTRGFLWEGGTMVDLGTLGGDESVALAVNENGEVVGWSETMASGRRPFLWSDGVVTDLSPGLPDSPSHSCSARGINDRSQVVLSCTHDTYPVDLLYVWDEGTLQGLPMDALGSLNNRGQVVGSWCNDEDDCMARVWDDGQVTDVRDAGWYSSVAVQINDASQMVGAYTNRTDGTFLWENGRITALEHVDLYPFTRPTAINETGVIIGRIFGHESGTGFVWEGGLMRVLPSPSGSSARPWAINDVGTIVGYLETHVGEWQAALWQKERPDPD